MGKPVLLALAVLLMGEVAPPIQPARSAGRNDVHAYDDLIRRCSSKETASLEAPRRLEFRERLEWSWGSETRVVIETADGRADRIVAFNDQSLAEDQQEKQRRRLLKLVSNSKARQNELAEQRDEAERRLKMIRDLSDAFSMEFSGVEPDGRLRFNFQPDPGFMPRNRETQVYRGMRGSLWIDPGAERIVRVEGTLFRDVSFGWGILGKLHKGGRFELAQTEIMPGVWRMTTLNLDLKARILLFSSMHIFRRESSSEFVMSPPGLNYHDALLRLLNNPPLPERETRAGQDRQ